MTITILLITDNHDATAGGAEKYFFELKNNIQKSPEFNCFSLGFGKEKKIEKNYHVIKETTSKLSRQFWRMFFNPIKYWQLRKIIKKVNPDIIHLHNVKKYTISLLKAVKGYCVVQTVHDYSLICPTQWNIHRDGLVCGTGFKNKCLWKHRRHFNFLSYFLLLFSFLRMRKLLKKTIKHFFVPSNLLKEYLLKQNFNSISVINPFKNTPKNISSASNNYFLFVGQLEKQKGIDLLVKEFALACEKDSSLTLKIVGQGSLEKNLKDWVNIKKLEKNILFLGWRNDLAEIYAQCRALIFPSIGLEAFGLVLLEAMSYKKAIIGSNRGPTKQVVEHQKNGLLFDPCIKGSLMQAILYLTENPDLVREYGENGFTKWQQFPSNQELLQEIFNFYKLKMASGAHRTLAIT